MPTSLPGTSPPLITSARWQALDGLRGYISMGVFTVHLKYAWLPGGIIFLDTFFILSSFFITRILLTHLMKEGRINFRAFYERRIRRLYPALLVMVIGVTLMTTFYMEQGHLGFLHVFAALFYFENWIRAFDVVHNPILGHTWSLSVEEQFYIVWPPVLSLLFAISWFHKRQKSYFLIALILIAIIIYGVTSRFMLAQLGTPWYRLYNGTDMHLDSLATGALIALFFGSRWLQILQKILAHPLVTWCLILGIIYGARTVDVFDTRWYAWMQPVYTLLSAGLIISLLSSPQRWGLGLVFENRFVLYMGYICYGFYLWHYPIVSLARDYWHMGDAAAVFFCSFTTFILASLSYHWIELPALQGRRGSAK